MIPDASVDFVFCFDSLVHAEADVLENYVAQISTKLTMQGVGFIHHSDLGSHIDKLTGELPPEIQNRHWRAKSVSAELVEEYCKRVRLECISQEIVHWGGDMLTDCFSILTREDSAWARATERFVNPKFMNEGKYVSSLARLYAHTLAHSR